MQNNFEQQPQLNPTLNNIKIKDKVGILKNITIVIGIAIFLLWIVWLTCDCIFVSKGLSTDIETLLDWDAKWYSITKNEAAVLLSLLGGYIGLLVANLVVLGLTFKSNFKHSLYQVIMLTAAFIALTICVIKSADMMIQEKFVLDFENGFNLYHLDYLKWMSIPAGILIYSTIVLATSFRGFSFKTIIRDFNILIIALAIANLAMYPAFCATMGWHDNLDWYADTWMHVVSQMVTSPMGVFSGMIMILLVARLIMIMFAYSDRLHVKKTHIIIFSIITVLVFAAFIAAHINKLDFKKLVFDYDSMRVGCFLIVSAEIFTCVAGGVYCAISHYRYVKRIE